MFNVCAYHILLVHLSMDGYLVCFHLLTLMKNAAVSMDAQVSWALAWCLWLMKFHPKVDLLDSVVILSGNLFWGITILFPTAPVPFCFPIKSSQGFPFVHVFANTYDWFSRVSQWCILTAAGLRAFVKTICVLTASKFCLQLSLSSVFQTWVSQMPNSSFRVKI